MTVGVFWGAAFLRFHSEPSCAPAARLLILSSILPVDRDEAGAAGGDGVGVIRAVFPGYRSIRSNLDELKLELPPGWDGGVEEPVGIIRSEHGPYRTIPGRAPVSQLYGAARQKDVIPNVGRCGVIHGEGNWDEFCSEHRELNRVCCGAPAVLQLYAIHTVCHAGDGESHGRVGPRRNGSRGGTEQDASRRSAKAFPRDGHSGPGLANGWAD